MTTQRAFDPVRFDIPRDFAEDASPEDMRTWLCGLGDRHLDGGPGYFVLTGLQHLDEPGMRAFALAASAALGRLLPQDSGGTLLREVRYRGVRLGEGATGRYSDSRDGGNLHTDSPHRPTAVPDYFALACVHQAAVGGDLVLVRLADVLDRLRGTPDVLRTLRRPVHFDTRDDSPGAPATVVRPVLEQRDGREHIHYLREYIELGHRRPGVPDLDAAQLLAFDALDALVESRDLQYTDRLSKGEMIFIDNRWTLHGRVAFEDREGDDRRLMLRTWITKAESVNG
ncbi:TauD/TfdA family dioxygenase [Streptomyces sp. NRRL F-5123]|uniref:TauD/TfdA family dioxygenase n=1 Tax=Streptomyces sp. NRRL F-5123 TaxID=1463856 RepID=UPI0004E189BA|nr:TauD/TfdA family dioxygenase [Streptomyces sp. NRRL F-5123]